MAQEMAVSKRRGFLGMIVLVALMLAVSYFGGDVTRIGSVHVPTTRVLEGGGVSAVQAVPVAPQVEAASGAPEIEIASQGFDQYRETVATARETAKELLDEVILSASASAETVEAALSQKAELARAVEMEAAAEAMLALRGFADAICSYQKGAVSVIVRGESLSQQQAAQILDIAMAATGEPASRIRVIASE